MLMLCIAFISHDAQFLVLRGTMNGGTAAEWCTESCTLVAGNTSQCGSPAWYVRRVQRYVHVRSCGQAVA